MNEQIKLPAQEWLGYDPERGDIHGYTFEQMREFGELIVRDCLKQIYRNTLMSTPEHQWTDQQLAYNEGIHAAYEKVKNHFGVK